MEKLICSGEQAASDPRPAGMVSVKARPLSHGRLVRRDFRHNAWAIALFEATWGFGWAFVILAILVPSYLGQLGAPRALIGVASALGVLTVPFQLLAERLAGGANRKRTTWLLFCSSALCYIVMGLIGTLLPADAARGWLIGLFVMVVAGFNITQNLCAPMYLAIMTENSPVNRRGRIMAGRAVAIGTTGLLAIVPARWILQQFSAVQAYHAAMLIAGTIFLLSSLCLLIVRDHRDPTWQRVDGRVPAWRTSVREAFDLAGELWGTRNYRSLICFAMILVGVAALGPFLVTFSRDQLGMVNGPGQGFKVVFLTALVLQAPIIGAIADRWGYKLTLVIQSLAMAIALAGGMIASSATMIVFSYGLFSCMAMWVPTAVCNLSIELLNKISPARLAAATNVLFLPACLAMSWGGGAIIDSARTSGEPGWGYRVVFASGGALALTAGLGILFLVREPRVPHPPAVTLVEHG